MLTTGAERPTRRAGRTAVAARRGWLASWLLTALLVAGLTSGCATAQPGQAVTGATPTSGTTKSVTTKSVTTKSTATQSTSVPSTADWNPAHLPTVAARIDQTAVTIRVGERLQFTPADADTVIYSLEPADLDSITWYGNLFTFIGVTPGTTELTIPNYDKHFDCPNGPCAHLNAPLRMTVTVLAGTTRAPKIAAPLTLTSGTKDQTVALRVGQRLEVPADVQLSGYSADAAGFALDGQLGRVEDGAGGVTLVAARPGRQLLGMDIGGASTSARLTVVIEP